LQNEQYTGQLCETISLCSNSPVFFPFIEIKHSIATMYRQNIVQDYNESRVLDFAAYLKLKKRSEARM